MSRCAAAAVLALALAGCTHIPFIPHKRDKIQSPEAVLRFARQAEALGEPPSPTLAEVTRALATAIEAMRGASHKPIELSQRVAAQAEKLAHASEADQPMLARPALDLALAVTQATRPPVPEREREEADEAQRDAVDRARHAIDQVVPGASPATVAMAYRELGQAMLRASGGPPGAATGGELSSLVLRCAVDDPELARRAGAQAVTGFAEALLRLPSLPKSALDAARRAHAQAAALADAPLLEYASQLKGVLARLVDAVEGLPLSSAAARLLADARRAVGAIRPDHPFELQRAVTQDALRALADVITVATMGERRSQEQATARGTARAR
jgi:hypothetical protein